MCDPHTILKACFHYSCAALRFAIDIETPIVFLYRSAAVVEILFYCRSDYHSGHSVDRAIYDMKGAHIHSPRLSSKIQ